MSTANNDTLPPAVRKLVYPCDRIFHLRALRGMSLGQLAEASGLREEAIRRLEQSAPAAITILEILDLARGLDANPAWLAYGLGEQGPYPFDPRAWWPGPDDESTAPAAVSPAP